MTEDSESLAIGAFELGEWTVEPMWFRITRGSAQVQVRPRAMEVLSCLAENAGQAVSKRQLIDEVWRTEFVSENALTHVIAELRTALGDDPQNPSYIETVPRHGYRLLPRPVAVHRSSFESAVGRPLPSAGPRTERFARTKAALGAAAALALLMGATVAILLKTGWSPRTGEPRFDPRRVVVEVFANHTGDEEVDCLGLLAADWITGGLYHVDGIRVAVNPYGSMGRGARPPVLAPGGDRLQRLAEQTGSGLVVDGAFYRGGEMIEIQTRIVNPWSGEVVQSFEPVRADPSDPSAAVETLRQLVAGTLAAHFDAVVELGTGRPVPLSAYREYRAAMQIWGRDPTVVAHLERALELAPEFHLARLMLVWALRIQGRMGAAEQQLRKLEGEVAELTPLDRIGVRLTRASLEGRREDVVVEGREAVRLAPGVSWMAVDLGVHLLSVNRPREALAVLRDIPCDWMPPGDGISSWPASVRARAHHLLGEYEAELEVATEAERFFPGSPDFIEHRVAALAALGRFEQLDRELASCVASAQHGRLAGKFMLCAARELRVHGHRNEGLAMARRSVTWYRAHPTLQNRRWLANALYAAEQWEEAGQIYEDLLVERPDDVALQGLLGVLAARRGDRVTAERISGELAARDHARSNGLPSLQRACIAAQLGELDQSVELLRQASAEGFRIDNFLRRFIDLEPLFGDPRFEALVAPKG